MLAYDGDDVCGVHLCCTMPADDHDHERMQPTSAQLALRLERNSALTSNDRVIGPS